MPDEPFAGWIDVPANGIVEEDRNQGLGRGDIARTAPMLMVTAETGGGKSRKVLAPNIIRWGTQPVVAMSAKGDLAQITIARRARRGPVYLLDLGGKVSEEELRDVPVTRVRVDPCANITNDDQALDMASLLMEVGAIGAGDGGGGGGDAGFWQSLARRRLACFLRAGGWYPDPETGEKVWGGGVDWALAACEDVGPDAAEDTGGQNVVREGLDEEAVEDLDDPEVPMDLTTPNWSTAYLRALAQGSRHSASLLAARQMDQRQRDSIGINCQVALSAWAQESVATDAVAFEPRMLAERGATLYIVSPSSGAAAPAAAITLSQIVDHWLDNFKRLDPVLFVLDEFTNGAPIPPRRFATWVTMGRGAKIRMCIAVQSTAQFELIRPAPAVKVMRRTFPSILVMKGSNEEELLESAAGWSLPEERGTAPVGADGRTSHSREQTQLLTKADLLPRRGNEGRLLLSGMAGIKVSLDDISHTDADD
ncbi:type IV secretory system conjugative DNA transfer family protein [Gordonia polyisoprenivorans]|uniref:type IV secretory system conjugative DNA transfer family protein n=1 Tax=Gordonia polyisoprenivorans TaxID=84595 RepID=UPI00223471A0|nr:type IV secretory system conjugative DNA transfer family protein [Gordonia polyisoprenivorans]